MISKRKQSFQDKPTALKEIVTLLDFLQEILLHFVGIVKHGYIAHESVGPLLLGLFAFLGKMKYKN